MVLNLAKAEVKRDLQLGDELKHFSLKRSLPLGIFLEVLEEIFRFLLLFGDQFTCPFGVELKCFELM